MAVTDYILSYDDVRILLGLAKKELPDNLIELQVFQIGVETYLTKLYSRTLDLYAELKKIEQDNKDDPSKPMLTRAQRAIKGVIQLVATYQVASSINIDTIGLKRITDGKSEQERFADAFKNTLADLKSDLDAYADQLRDLMEAYGEPIPPITYNYHVGSAALAVDPVTGE